MEQKDNYLKQNEIKHTSTKVKVAVISPNKIDHKMKHSDPNFLSLALSSVMIKELNPDNFLQDYENFIEYKKYLLDETKNHVIYEYKDNIYELFFGVKNDGKKLEETRNDLGTLLDIEGNYVFGNCILIKSQVSNTDIKMVDISKEDIHDLLFRRGNPHCITWIGEEFYEAMIKNLDDYIKHIFGEDKVYTKEIIICNYSLTIYYNKNEYGEIAIPNFIDTPSDYMVIVSNWTDKLLESLSLEEFNMIKKLLTLNKLEFDKEIVKEKKDSLGRDIIYTKYNILKTMYLKSI
jgi:hypothetical protein